MDAWFCETFLNKQLSCYQWWERMPPTFFFLSLIVGWRKVINFDKSTPYFRFVWFDLEANHWCLHNGRNPFPPHRARAKKSDDVLVSSRSADQWSNNEPGGEHGWSGGVWKALKNPKSPENFLFPLLHLLKLFSHTLTYIHYESRYCIRPTIRLRLCHEGVCDWYCTMGRRGSLCFWIIICLCSLVSTHTDC